MKLTGDRCRCSGPPYRGCGELFNSVAAFDKHRTGPFDGLRRCLTIPEMLARGMAQNAAGHWITAKNQSYGLRKRVSGTIDPTPCPGSPLEQICPNTSP